MRKYVGLDVHSKFCVFAIQDEQGQLLAEGRVLTDREGLREMRDQHALAPGTEVGLESGTVSFYVADLLTELGLRPIVIDAGQVRRFCSRPEQKSDRRDALELCSGIRTGKYTAIVSVPPRSVRELREVLSRRRHFVRLQTAQVNAVKRLLRSRGKVGSSRCLGSDLGWLKLLDPLAPEVRLHGHVSRHYALWSCADEQVLALEREIRELTQPWKEQIDHLKTAPGVGTIVASTFFAVVFDAKRFPTAKHIAGYAGLVPTTDQSGTRDRHGRISKRGSGELRAMLCEAAQHSRRLTNPLNPYFHKVMHRHGYQRAITAVAHRLCRILYAMLRDGVDFDQAKAGVEAGRFERVSTRHYRLAVKQA